MTKRADRERAIRFGIVLYVVAGVGLAIFGVLIWGIGVSPHMVSMQGDMMKVPPQEASLSGRTSKISFGAGTQTNQSSAGQIF
jgi:hypothetical protein